MGPAQAAGLRSWVGCAEDRFTIIGLFADERCSQLFLGFLAITHVGIGQTDPGGRRGGVACEVSESEPRE